jgi:hypothetical protein
MRESAAHHMGESVTHHKGDSDVCVKGDPVMCQIDGLESSVQVPPGNNNLCLCPR